MVAREMTMKDYRLTLTLPSGDLHELHVSARSRAYAEDLAIAALDIYHALSATLELAEAPARSGAQISRPYWLH